MSIERGISLDGSIAVADTRPMAILLIGVVNYVGKLAYVTPPPPMPYVGHHVTYHGMMTTASYVTSGYDPEWSEPTASIWRAGFVFPTPDVAPVVGSCGAMSWQGGMLYQATVKHVVAIGEEVFLELEATHGIVSSGLQP